MALNVDNEPVPRCFFEHQHYHQITVSTQEALRKRSAAPVQQVSGVRVVDTFRLMEECQGAEHRWRDFFNWQGAEAAC